MLFENFLAISKDADCLCDIELVQSKICTYIENLSFGAKASCNGVKYRRPTVLSRLFHPILL